MNVEISEHEEGCRRCKGVRLTLRRIRGFSGVSGHPSRSLSASSNISVTFRYKTRQKKKNMRRLRWLRGKRATLHVWLWAIPLHSTSSPPSLWPGVYQVWIGLRSQLALHPGWRTDAPCSDGFFPGSSGDLSPSAALCAWMHINSSLATSSQQNTVTVG